MNRLPFQRSRGLKAIITALFFISLNGCGEGSDDDDNDGTNMTIGPMDTGVLPDDQQTMDNEDDDDDGDDGDDDAVQ